MIRSQSYCFLTIYFFFCFFALPNTFASPTPSLCRRDQRDTLLELEKEFHVLPTNSWNKSVDCCSWEGVTCDSILGEVISLQLYPYAIGNASLKSSSGLFKLQHLRNLDLSNCDLQGEIPSSIGNLYHLTSLNLTGNQLVGEVPASIGNLNQLREINLSGNKLRGNIPTSFANLTKLSHIRLSASGITSLKSISSLFKLQHLRELDLSNCGLQGEIPSSIGNLSHLTSLDLSGNKLRGNIPTSFANLTELSSLSLGGNQFTGGEIVLANLTSLSEIDLSSNHFKSSFFGLFPSFLLMFPSLVDIDISHNQFEGTIDFGNISSSSKLEGLDVAYNNFDGLIPESISKLVNLAVLDLSYNRLEGQVPQFLWRSSKLNSVLLSHNSLSSLGKSVEIADGASIFELYLGSNSFQGPFPQWICNYRDVQILDLSNNYFSGSIPKCLESFNLITLNLRNNSLSGFLPNLCSLRMSSSEYKYSLLQSLDVSRNNLVGKLQNP